MGLFNVLGSLQNIESAEAAGDSYETRPSLTINGLGSIAAALFGSAFPTTIYIGHPGWKALGARAGYSVLNGAFITIICVTGTLAWIAWAIPIDAGMAIVLWIGIVISAQAFQATPREHAPAVVIGLLPGIGAWGALMAKNGLHAAGMGGAARPFSEALIGEFQKSDTWIHGAFSLEQGFLFTSMLLSAAVVGVIERKWAAAAWCGLAALISATGPDALLSVDGGRHRAEARARVAVRDRLRHHGAVLLHRQVDDRAERRALTITPGTKETAPGEGGGAAGRRPRRRTPGPSDRPTPTRKNQGGGGPPPATPEAQSAGSRKRQEGKQGKQRRERGRGAKRRPPARPPPPGQRGSAETRAG